MKATFKITAALLAEIRVDLHRPHAFAHERVGFIAAGLSSVQCDLMILARDYLPVQDADYLRDSSVGAMMGPHAIRKALEWAMRDGHAIFHVHSHDGRGVPGFSGIDLRENQKFIPDFFKVAPHCAHGALVLSGDAACGQMWLARAKNPVRINDFVEVGPTIRKWKAA
jgi:hypothetical protein